MEGCLGGVGKEGDEIRTTKNSVEVLFSYFTIYLIAWKVEDEENHT